MRLCLRVILHTPCESGGPPDAGDGEFSACARREHFLARRFERWGARNDLVSRHRCDRVRDRASRAGGGSHAAGHQGAAELWFEGTRQTGCHAPLRTVRWPGCSEGRCRAVLASGCSDVTLAGNRATRAALETLSHSPLLRSEPGRAHLIPLAQFLPHSQIATRDVRRPKLLALIDLGRRNRREKQGDLLHRRTAQIPRRGSRMCELRCLCR